MRRLLAPFLAVLLLGGCAQYGYAPNTAGGTLVGAGLGGFAGSQLGRGSGKLAATGAGVLLGGLLGSNVGGSLDRGNAAYYGGGYGYPRQAYAPPPRAYYYAPPPPPPGYYYYGY